jgi:hypothetical protein
LARLVEPIPVQAIETLVPVDVGLEGAHGGLPQLIHRPGVERKVVRETSDQLRPGDLGVFRPDRQHESTPARYREPAAGQVVSRHPRQDQEDGGQGDRPRRERSHVSAPSPLHHELDAAEDEQREQPVLEDRPRQDQHREQGSARRGERDAAPPDGAMGQHAEGPVTQQDQGRQATLVVVGDADQHQDASDDRRGPPAEHRPHDQGRGGDQEGRDDGARPLDVLSHRRGPGTLVGNEALGVDAVEVGAEREDGRQEERISGSA